MKSIRGIFAVAAIVTSVRAQDDNSTDWEGIVYGDGSTAIVDYTRANLPYRNASIYPLRYQSFNWSYAGPAQDDGYWTVRYNTADNYLPGNLSATGAEKIVVTSYGLLWEGHDTYNNLSSKIANDTDALREAGILQQPPNMCFGFMGHDSDFEDSVKKNMDVTAQDPCLSLFGDECAASLQQAFTSAFDSDCSFDSGTILGSLPGCDDTWAKRTNGLTFLTSLLANGSQASNASYTSPSNDSDVGYQIQLHATDDNSTYDKELARTQFVVFKESGKDAQLLCMRFEASAVRAIAGTSMLITVALAGALLFELI